MTREREKAKLEYEMANIRNRLCLKPGMLLAFSPEMKRDNPNLDTTIVTTLKKIQILTDFMEHVCSNL